MPAGRPTDLTPEVIEDVRRLLPIVLYLETVADYIGVTRQAIRFWIKRGRQEEKRLERKGARPKESEAIYLQFFHVMKRALAEGEIADAGLIKKVATGTDDSPPQWQAAAWRLERRFPEKWSRDRAIIRELEKRIKTLEAERNESGTAPPEETPGSPGRAEGDGGAC